MHLTNYIALCNITNAGQEDVLHLQGSVPEADVASVSGLSESCG